MLDGWDHRLLIDMSLPTTEKNELILTVRKQWNFWFQVDVRNWLNLETGLGKKCLSQKLTPSCPSTFVTVLQSSSTVAFRVSSKYTKNWKLLWSYELKMNYFLLLRFPSKWLTIASIGTRQISRLFKVRNRQVPISKLRNRRTLKIWIKATVATLNWLLAQLQEVSHCFKHLTVEAQINYSRSNDWRNIKIQVKLTSFCGNKRKSRK